MFAYEAALTQALAEWRPDCTVPLLAVDLQRGWMLSDDAGPELRQMRDAYLEPWTGTWSTQEADEFRQAIADLNLIDPTLWQ